ncbi:MAG: hypothetical protein ACYTFW_20285 [Planctomycetota bacterium]|jgi:hypothetical protein
MNAREKTSKWAVSDSNRTFVDEYACGYKYQQGKNLPMLPTTANCFVIILDGGQKL